MQIAIFADVHGHLLARFDQCALWQQHTGQTLDLILVAGDLAIFPDPARLDRATRRHSERNPAVLGFSREFLTPHPEVAERLARTSCPLIFVRGNHEDHAWLDALEKRSAQPMFSVDAYQRMYYLKSGVPYTFTCGAETISLLGIGRIGRPANSHRSKPHYIQSYEQERLARLGEHTIDLLLTHDAARDQLIPDSGSEVINRILVSHAPRYHFFGHYGGESWCHLHANGQTMSCKLADFSEALQSDENSANAGSMALLHWHNRDSHSLDLLTSVFH